MKVMTIPFLVYIKFNDSRKVNNCYCANEQ